MTVVRIRVEQGGKYIYSGLNADTRPVTPPIGSKYYIAEGGIEEYFGVTAGWVKTHDAFGAAIVSSGFKPSSYTGKISSTEDGATFAIAAGATHILFQSLDLAVSGVAEYAVIAFGTSASNAQLNLVKTGTTPNIIATAGIVIGSGESVGGNPIPPISIPSLATHCAIGNGIAATVIQIMVTQGAY